MSTIRVLLALPIAAVATGAAMAGVSLSGPFADGAVLQRGMRVPIWGTALPGEKVVVSFAGQSVDAVADDSGEWCAVLAPMEACSNGQELKVVGKSDDSSDVVNDVLVGEVWFCCGQSNAELPLVSNNPRFRDAKGSMRAQMTTKPLIRYCHQSIYKASAKPRRTCRYKPEWKAFTPENLGREPSFSAMGVYFALELHSALSMPIGIVGAWWGGTGITPWTPRSGLLSIRETKAAGQYQILSQDEFRAIPKDSRRYSSFKAQPSVLWNEMVSPWTPYAIRGFIWYQGCNNISDGARYTARMHALYNGWRKEFKNNDLRMRFVQLTPMGDERIAAIQMAQATFAANEPHAKMAIINDIGNLFDCHPNNKETVGQRLALLALKYDYGFSVKADSPTVKSARVEGKSFIVEFDNAESLYMYNPDRSLKAGFEICGSDGEWKLGVIKNLDGDNGNIIGARIIVEADGVANPKKLRYLHSRPWFGCIYNEVNLPLGPFEIALFQSEK